METLRITAQPKKAELTGPFLVSVCTAFGFQTALLLTMGIIALRSKHKLIHHLGKNHAKDKADA